MEQAAYSNEITELFLKIGYLMEGQKNIKDHVQRLDDRINGNFKVIDNHIKSSDRFRGMVTTHEEKFKNYDAQMWLLTKIFIGFNIMILGSLVAIFFVR